MKNKNYRFSYTGMTAFTIILVSLIPILSFSQSWLDPDWQYRNQVLVTNPGVSTLSEFQVKISLDSLFDFSLAEADGGDIRITESDGTTLLPFWIESWDTIAKEALIWTKLPEIAESGNTVYLYYGNPGATITLPDPVETPPVGPFTRAEDNPISPIGDPGGGASLLGENIVYDSVSGHYWLVFANYRGSSPGVGLVWSDTPADAASWHWFGNVYTHTSGGSFAPNILKENGLWYIFFARWPNIVYMTSPTVDGPYSEPTVVLSPSETWEAYRVDEPYVFKRNDGKWIMIYMADAGGVTEQVGYASADDITGPYTKFSGNPCLAFGPSGSYDAGTIADPWVYEFDGVYYIGYTVSPSKSSPWQTALATTTDWNTFTKHGVIFPLAASGWDAVNSFRGAVTRVGDTYVFSYTGDGYRMGVATQPVFMTPEVMINNGDAVFDFFDGFDGTEIDLSKWTFANGNSAQTSVENGMLTLTSTSASDYVRILGQQSFGMDYTMETRAMHPDQGTENKISELGFADNSWNTIRIVDDFPSVTHWQRQSKLAGQTGTLIDMAQTADQDWHIFQLYRKSPDIAGFQIDSNPVETINTDVPTLNLPPFLMSFGTANQFIVDWTRVRKRSDPEPITYFIADSVDLTAIETHTPILCHGEQSTVNIIAIGGTPPYTGTGTFMQSAGTVIYSVMDAMGDTSNVTLTLNEPDTLQVSYINTPILCNGDSSTVTISATGGTQPYINTGEFSFTAGNHILTITDANGCTADITIEITEPAALDIEAFWTEIPYPGGSSEVTISATGGTPPYNGTGTFSQQAGTVDYEVTDDNGCVSQVQVTITDPSTWMDMDWLYRRPVEVSNPGSTELSDFQVKIQLDDTFDFSKALSDGSDLRVTAIDKTTLLPFWIESWDSAGQQAVIWVKIPTLPVQGTTVFLYYGNAEPTIPAPVPVETPPTGPFSRAVGNPIVPIGDPGAGASLLAENIVYDDATGHYWLAFANYRSGSHGVGLVWSDTPTDASSWHWHGNVYNHSGSGGSFAPHILKEGGLWYIFFAKFPDIAYITSPTIDGTYSTPTTILSPSETWETYRVDEPYVFQRNDGKWVLMYMGDYGGTHEQIGYALADAITGPYTKYENNPCLPFGPPGSYDAGTVADPWVVEFNGVYYIGYAASPTTSSPWQTALATTTDWQTFDRHGIILPLAGSGWDSNNCFRGAVSRFGDTYIFSYTGDSYKMGIATQPVYMTPVSTINNGNAVFDLFDDFEGGGDSSPDFSRWSLASGNVSQLTVDSGLLTLNATTTYVKLNSIESFGMGTVFETRASHPDQGTQDMIGEMGFADNNWNSIRIVDDFLLGTTYWQRQAKINTDPDEFVNMAQQADQDWHQFRVFRKSPDTAGFQIDDHPVEIASGTATTTVPTLPIPAFFMSYGNGNRVVVDWARVRKWTGEDPSISFGEEEGMQILNLNVKLEGPFKGTSMDTNLVKQSVLPLNQPFNTSPWNYDGNEEITGDPVSAVVDWVLVELRDAQDTSLAGTSTRVFRQAALLLNDGRIVGMDGNSFLLADVPVENQLFVVIHHRNHISIMSANAIPRDPTGLYTYDFSTSADQTYGNGQLYLGNGIYGMIGGDADSNGSIDEQDLITPWGIQAGEQGYLNGDMNLDGQVDNKDKDDIWLHNLGETSQIPE